MDAPCQLSPASGSVPWQGGRLPLPPRDLPLPGGAELRDRRGCKLKRRKGNRNPHNHRALGAEALGDAPDFLAAWLLRQPAAGHGTVPARGGGEQRRRRSAGKAAVVERMSSEGGRGRFWGARVAGRARSSAGDLVPSCDGSLCRGAGSGHKAGLCQPPDLPKWAAGDARKCSV